MARIFYICSNCKTKFRRQTYMQRTCDACKEYTTQRLQEKHKENNLWQQTRTRIFNRDDNQCKICHTSEKLHIHHWDKNPSNNNFDNLTTLCSYCHSHIHSIYNKVSKGKPHIKKVKEWIIGNCKRCNKQFKTKRDDKIFCSDYCSKKTKKEKIM